MSQAFRLFWDLIGEFLSLHEGLFLLVCFAFQTLRKTLLFDYSLSRQTILGGSSVAHWPEVGNFWSTTLFGIQLPQIEFFFLCARPCGSYTLRPVLGSCNCKLHYCSPHLSFIQCTPRYIYFDFSMKRSFFFFLQIFLPWQLY